MSKNQAVSGYFMGSSYAREKHEIHLGAGRESYLSIGCLMTDIEQHVEHVLRRRLGVSLTARDSWLITRIGWSPVADDTHRSPWEIADELEESCRTLSPRATSKR